MNKMAGVYIAKLSKDINEQYEFYWATKGRANRIDYDYYKNEEARRLSVSAAVRKAKEEMDRKIWAAAEAKRQEILKKERAEQAERELREQEILREFKEAEEQRAREAMAEASELPEIPEDEIIEPTIDIENENEQPEGAQTEGGQVVDGEGQEVELPENVQNDVDLQENEMQSTGDLVIEDDAVPLHRVEDEIISKSEVEGVESVVDTDLIN